jgi:hypothetical protein
LVRRRGLALPAETSLVIVVLAVLIVFGFGLRMRGIDRIGFAEDEINKLEAINAYGRGDITPNAEHPMVMKTLIFASFHAAHAANSFFEEPRISDEAALRFPNILIGALTVIPLFLLTAALFDRRTAAITSALWAFGVNAITYNRTAKEDTLLVFFMLFAFYFYLRAKQTSNFEEVSKRKFYSWSGVSFGLMLASKYFPHYFGLNALYHHLVHVRNREPGEPSGRTPRVFYILIAAVFLLANPAVLLPQTWSYLQSYSSEQLLTHTGYLLGDNLYKNTMSVTPFGGTPVYFYALFLAIKVPLTVTAALLLGLVQCFRRWRSPGPAFALLMFGLWIIPYSLTGAKWPRYSLSLMPWVYMISAVGTVWLIQSCARVFKSLSVNTPTVYATAVVCAVFIGWPVWTAYASAPYYATYTNALAKGRAGYYFPHDEFYDAGLREAIQYVCENAPQGAMVLHETPGVVRTYMARFGRTDLRPRALSEPDITLGSIPSDTFVILQRGRTYFENDAKMKEVRARFQKVNEVLVAGASAVEVYRNR